MVTMPEQQTQHASPPLGFTFIRDLDAVSPEVHESVLKGREILSRRAARNRET